MFVKIRCSTQLMFNIEMELTDAERCSLIDLLNSALSHSTFGQNEGNKLRDVLRQTVKP